MSGPPGEVRQVVHTLRAVGPVTEHLHRLRAGDTIGLRGPFGTPWPVEACEGSDIIFLAGGIGLAPLRPALYHVLARRERYGRVVVLFGARTPHDILFTREIELWRARFDITVEVVVDRAAPGWHGFVGVVTSLVPRGTVRSPQGGRHGLRARDHDEVRHAGARRPRRRRVAGYTYRSSAT